MPKVGDTIPTTAISASSTQLEKLVARQSKPHTFELDAISTAIGGELCRHCGCRIDNRVHRTFS